MFDYFITGALLVIAILAYQKSGNDKALAVRSPLLWLSAGAVVAFVIQAANLIA